MNLIIVESPTKARTLFRFLGGDFLIEATMGHVRDLPKSKFGVDLEHDFRPEYVIISGKEKNIKVIKNASKAAEKIFLATDPDREGEAIAWHINRLLGYSDIGLLGNKKQNQTAKQPKSPIARIVFHEITERAIKEALVHPRSLDMDLVDAQQARRILDRIVGYKLSPLLWRKVRRGLSAGRVQSVAVRLIVEREREIEAFVSQEYWEIYCEVEPLRVLPRVLPPASARPPAGRAARVSGSLPPVSPAVGSFLVKLIQIDDAKAEIKNKQSLLLRSKEQADKVVSDLEKAEYRVESVEKKEVSKSPYPPFTTSTMTQTMARLFFWSAKRTMSVAQKLYEEGLITYHRTDSTNLAAEAVSRVRDFIVKEYGEAYLPEKPRFYKIKSKVAQEAHEAIRPTDVNFKFQISNFKLGSNEGKLYDLIWKRFLACQMANAIYDETTISVEASAKLKAPAKGEARQRRQNSKLYLLQARGQVMKFGGWRKVYGGMEKVETPLPDVKKNEQLQLIKISPLQKFTEPPARYSEATLIKTLEKLGIGRPSTYAPIISTIQERAYVEKIDPSVSFGQTPFDEAQGGQDRGSGQGGRFRPTPVGVATNDFLVTNFPDVVDYKFTARMEDDLDEIANGKVKWIPVIRDFWEPFDKKLEEVQELAKRVKIATEDTGEECPKCKKAMPAGRQGKQVIRIGRFGKFLSCSRFPDCDWTEQYMEKVGMKCPDCAKGEVIIRQTKRKYRFYGCSRYPACRWASWRKPKLDDSEQVTGDT